MRKKQWWPYKTETLERAAYIVTIFGFPLLLISISIVLFQVIDARQIATMQNNIALNTEFYRGNNIGILDAIENNRKILKENGGQYSPTQLDKFLGDFEMINQAYRESFLTEGQLCTSFSYYIAATFKNEEVLKHMANNPDYFSGARELNAKIAKSKTPDCH